MKETTMPLRQQLAELAKRRGGIWLEQPGRPPAIFDHRTRRCWRAPDGWNDGEDDEEALIQEAERLLADDGGETRRYRTQIAIHLRIEDLEDGTLFQGAATAARALNTTPMLRVVVHFGHAPSDWGPVLDWSARFRETAFTGKEKAWIELLGPFGYMEDDTKRELHRLALQIAYAPDWQNAESTADSPWDPDVVSDLAEFGIRVPIVWYVHDGNIDAIADLLEASLVANYESGIALPLACESIYHRAESDAPVLADRSDDYLRLLHRAYRDFPHADDQLAPIAELAQVALRQKYNGRPRGLPVQLLAERSGLKVFRQIPALGRPWMNWDQVDATEPSEFRAKLDAFCEKEFIENAHWQCDGCQWRGLCGGSDVTDSSNLDNYRAVQEAICQYRQVFLEAFLWQRLKIEERKQSLKKPTTETEEAPQPTEGG
jgi:hypothetical protein